MDDEAPQEGSPSGFNKIDLSQLQGFSFGTQWTQDKSAPSGGGERRDRRDDSGPGPAAKRDRRAFRKPDRPAGDAGPASGEREAQPGRDRGMDRRPPRRDSGPGRPREGYGRPPPREEAPYDSPVFSTTFYPEDASFAALVKTIRASCRTIELFEIARTVLGKAERFTVLLARRTPGEGAARPAEGEARPSADAAPKQPLYVSVPDGVPFETEEAAVAHVMSRHLGRFFDQAEVETEPPKGNFQVVNRCTVTGELLAPPNYHRYAQIVQQHHAARIRGMALETYKGRIESVRDPEVIKQWLEKMKKVTRYTWKSAEPRPAAKEAPAAAKLEDPQVESSSGDAVPSGEAVEAVAAEVNAAANEPPKGEEPPAPAEVAAAPVAEPTPASPAGPSFDTLDEARQHLLAHARDRAVRTSATARFHGRELAEFPAGEARHAVEGALERQRRFPLDTANALRGRLRRERFTIFKKGSKGISYVCAVKRKFRVPGQVLAQSIDALIGFIEAHPMVKAGDLPKAFLGLSIEAAPAEAGTPPPAPSPEEREKLGRLHGDLLWLVREGYVTEFIDGTLYAPPPIPEARKKEVEAEEVDPESFPEAPAAPVVEAAPEAAAIDPAPAPPTDVGAAPPAPLA